MTEDYPDGLECPTCLGTGRLAFITDRGPCTLCGATGRITEAMGSTQRNLTISYPSVTNPDE